MDTALDIAGNTPTRVIGCTTCNSMTWLRAKGIEDLALIAHPESFSSTWSKNKTWGEFQQNGKKRKRNEMVGAVKDLGI